ncbi:Pre-mRNA-splicing factor cef1 [Elasticomyces elasticus]|nr:Pre-mRNA-splicing factor cef1 [Elasticomyces elasticus]
MPVVKGGIWTNIEDEILKAAVSKYGLNQWARVSSLLARKTPKQCKARWAEWLDPGIRKIEWSREEDEKLLHLAKLMPTQWRTIAPIVGRTATQCLERYQKLLDEAEIREGGQAGEAGLGLGGPDGGEGMAPSADDVRKLRPGELDPDPESKPARPDTIDLDEDEKEMLSEARARLANTQGKKAKRKARERQLEESRRLAVLQKRRELKNAGINTKVTTKKKGQMDYNADIPFEKPAAPGFYDTQDEISMNEHEREMFDPRKQQLANKRKGDGLEVEMQETKRMKKDRDGGASSFAAAAKAGQLQRIREAEQSSKRRGLVLPAPQVSESELEDIVKQGLTGSQAHSLAEEGGNETTRGLLGNYESRVGATPMRTPMAPQEGDRIANELRNARARTETQSVLFGGENSDLVDGEATTGFQGVAPSAQTLSTPNPLATPMRNGMAGGGSGGGVGATPMRTPRDNFRLNQDDGGMQLVGQTPRDVRLREQAAKSSLRGKLAGLPKPRETEWELEVPDDDLDESVGVGGEMSGEDAGVRDQRIAERDYADKVKDLGRQTMVVQRGLPRPKMVDFEGLMGRAGGIEDPIERQIAEESARLMASDAQKFGGARVKGTVVAIEVLDEEAARNAKMEVLLEMGQDADRALFGQAFEREWEVAHAGTILPGLVGYADDELDEGQLVAEAFAAVEEKLTVEAEKGASLEKKLGKVHGGYIARQKVLKSKIAQAAAKLEVMRVDGETGRWAMVAEESGVGERMEGLRGEVGFVSRREREAQDVYRGRREELEGLQ